MCIPSSALKIMETEGNETITPAYITEILHHPVEDYPNDLASRQHDMNVGLVWCCSAARPPL